MNQWIPLSKQYPNLLGVTDREVMEFLTQFEDLPYQRTYRMGVRQTLGDRRINAFVNKAPMTPFKLPRGFVAEYLHCIRVYDRDEIFSAFQRLATELARKIWSPPGLSGSRLTEHRLKTLSADMSGVDHSYTRNLKISKQVFDTDLIPRILNSPCTYYICTPRGGLEMLGVFAYAASISKVRIPGSFFHTISTPIVLGDGGEPVGAWSRSPMFARYDRARKVGIERVVRWAEELYATTEGTDLLNKRWDRIIDKETFVASAYAICDQVMLSKITSEDITTAADKATPALIDHPGVRASVVTELAIMYAPLELWPTSAQRALGNWYPFDWLGSLWYPTPVRNIVVVDDIIASGEQMRDVCAQVTELLGRDVNIFSVHLAVRRNTREPVCTKNKEHAVWDITTEGISDWYHGGMRRDQWITALFPHACPDGYSDLILHKLYGERCSPRYRISGD